MLTTACIGVSAKNHQVLTVLEMVEAETKSAKEWEIEKLMSGEIK